MFSKIWTLLGRGSSSLILYLFGLIVIIAWNIIIELKEPKWYIMMMRWFNQRKTQDLKNSFLNLNRNRTQRISMTLRRTRNSLAFLELIQETYLAIRNTFLFHQRVFGRSNQSMESPHSALVNKLLKKYNYLFYFVLQELIHK